MNYETYQTMSAKQKEEYNFRFPKECDATSNSWTITMIVVLTMMSLITSLASFALLTKDTHPELLTQMGKLATKIILAVAIVMVLELIFNCVGPVIAGYKERQFMKKHDIRKVVT